MKLSILCPALLALAGLLATPSFGQAPPAPGAAPPPPGAAPPPPAPGAPPPPGPAEAAAAPSPPPPPPPPRGPAVILDHGPGGTVHIDVRCTEAETTRACVDIATQLYDRLNGAVQAK